MLNQTTKPLEGATNGYKPRRRGRGLRQGFVCRACRYGSAMTASSTLEMRLSGRGESTTPAEAAEAVLEVEPEDEDTESRFSNLVHWGYGHGLGERAGSAGFGRTLRTNGHRGAPRARLGLRAGRVAGAERLGPRLQVRLEGDRHGSPPPHRLRRGDRTRLRLPGQNPGPLNRPGHYPRVRPAPWPKRNPRCAGNVRSGSGPALQRPRRRAPTARAPGLRRPPLWPAPGRGGRRRAAHKEPRLLCRVA